jgi:hypothetical protein
MDYTHAPVSLLLRGPLLTTPQGWVCIGASAAYIGAALFFSLTETVPPFGWSRGKTSTLFAVWPALLFLYFIKDNLPDFSPSWKAAGWHAFIASLPLLLGCWRFIGPT